MLLTPEQPREAGMLDVAHLAVEPLESQQCKRTASSSCGPVTQPEALKHHVALGGHQPYQEISQEGEVERERLIEGEMWEARMRVRWS